MAMARSRCTWVHCPEPGAYRSWDAWTLASSLALLDHHGAGKQDTEVDLNLIPSIF